MKLEFGSSGAPSPISNASMGKSSSPRKMARHQAEVDEIFEAFRLFSQDTGIYIYKK